MVGKTDTTKKEPVFKRGFCACESVGRTLSGANYVGRKVKSVRPRSNLYKKSESIKSRFLR